MNTFNLTAPLPDGTLLLEASAGTGKTFTIAALAARYLAERGVNITDLLLITFGRHATNELRSRVFERIQDTLAYLNDRAAGLPEPEDPDPVSKLLADSDDAELHRQRLAAAHSHFNEATILTTHSFCQSMLQELGILGDWDPAEVVREDPPELGRQCATDVYIKRYRTNPNPPIAADEGLKIGQEVCASALPLLPASGERREFADEVRALYTARKAAEGVCTYDDITARLLLALSDPVTGPEVVARLRDRFPVVLVDEFQDTDPDQWAIIERAFAAPGRPTILIGDPKQSIYGFRGADISSYLLARKKATVATLGTNYRSDKPVVDGITALFGDTPLGDDTVQVHAVDAANVEPRLTGPGTARVWLRRAAQGQGVDSRESIEHDLVSILRRLLSPETQLDGRRVQPSDIAILVRTGARASRLRAILNAHGHPSVITGSQSVWHQPAAQEWLSLLRALADPRQDAIRMAALSSLIGADLADLLDPASPVPGHVSAQIRDLLHRFDSGGIAAVHTALRVGGLDARILGAPDGERLLSDLNQLAELLSASGEGTLAGLIALCEEQMAADNADGPVRATEEDSAIRIMTIHAAKGLEFPIVFLPEVDGIGPRAWDPFPVIADGRRHLWIGGWPDPSDPIGGDYRRQSLEEELRLLYVAFTRAKHLAVAWHVNPQKPKFTPAINVLLKQHGQRLNATTPIVTLPGLVLDMQLDPTPPTAAPGEPASASEQPELSVARFTRSIDHTWVRTSYSGLTHGLHEPVSRLALDEAPDVDVVVAGSSDPELGRPSPMAGLPAGAAFGTLVHEALERLDWSAARLADSAAALAADLGPLNSLDDAQTVQLGEALRAVATTPLSPLWDGSLSDIALSNRLPELDFDLPLADAGAPATLKQLAELMAEHLPASDPLAAYPSRLATSDAAQAMLNGFLTGSIDGVLMLPDGRFIVVDYKTNRLGGALPEEQVVGNYQPDVMAEAMMQAHYPLQAMLYCVALHRYLTLRLPDYSPETHLAGVGYLFVRGMAGADTPVVAGARCGVMAWFPPPQLVVAASSLLGGTP